MQGRDSPWGVYGAAAVSATDLADVARVGQKDEMAITSEDIAGMLFIAGVGAFASFAILALLKRAKSNMRFALLVQSFIILGLGFLFLIGAGLASPPGYPHFLIPVVFIIVLGLSHWLWRLANPTD